MILLILWKRQILLIKLKTLYRNANSNKTKHVPVEKELNELSGKIKLLSTKDYSFFRSRICFTSADGSQNMFFYQPVFNVLQLQNDKGTE